MNVSQYTWLPLHLSIHSKNGFVVITTMYVKCSAESQKVGNIYFLERWSEQACSTLFTTGWESNTILVMDSLWLQSISVLMACGSPLDGSLLVLWL